jgi:phage terminase large subunit-like protein
MSDCSATRFTPPLSEDFPTDGDLLIRLAEQVWRIPEDDYKPLRLHDWQKDLLRRVLERYPEDHPDPELAGRLRYKQVLVSVPRKQGKSVLGALMALYGMLLHDPAPEVLSVAASAEQARIVYRRLLYQINNTPALKRRMMRATDTRGIYLSGREGSYKAVAANASTLQGLHPSLVVFDELHVSKDTVWTAMALGSATRKDGMLFGITTAGDDNSSLLIHLYETAVAAIDGDETLERFGAFIWEAPEGCTLDDQEAVKQANPALREGHLSWSNVKNELATMPESDARRYRLNQFVSATNTWVPIDAWTKCAGEALPLGPETFFAIDRTPDWSYASIVAARKTGDVTHTELVASFTNPTQEQLVEACITLSQHQPEAYVMDNFVLNGLAEELRKRGLRVKTYTLKDVCAAGSMTYSKVLQGLISHANDPLVNIQNTKAVRKAVGEAWRISRRHSTTEIDAVMATTFAVYAAETTERETVQVF